MFTKYWREYPWWMQVFLYLMLVFVLLNFGQAIQMFTFPKIFHVSVGELISVTPKSPEALVHASLWSQVLTQISWFLVPGLLFAYFLHPRPKKVLNLTTPHRPFHFILVAFIIIGALPLLLSLDALTRQLFTFPKIFQELQEVNDNLFKTFLMIDSVPEFVAVVLAMALVPALGEEITFRGLIMRFVAQKKNSIFLMVTMPALIFAVIHFNPYGLLAIFSAAVMLALIYFWTGSLWCSIFAHFLFNAIQIGLIYFSNTSSALNTIVEGDRLPSQYIVIGAVIFGLSFFALYKTRNPLEKNWFKDFTEEELAQKKNN